MPVHATAQFNLTARLEKKEKRKRRRRLCVMSARSCHLQLLSCLFSFQEHMILCRFADQTAVQLPPERRLIGKAVAVPL